MSRIALRAAARFCVLGVVLLTAVRGAPASEPASPISVESRVTIIFETLADPQAKKPAREDALAGLRALSRHERRDAARFLTPYLDTIHIYEQLALPKAYRALGNVAVPILMDVARTNAEPLVRRRAVWLLGEMRDARTLPLLTDSLDDDDWLMRRAAAAAVGKLGRRARPAAPDLHALAADPEEPVRNAVAIALGRIGDTRSVAPLATMLSDPYFSVRFPAALSLMQLGKPGRAAIRQALDGDDALVQRAALMALTRRTARRMAPELRALLHSPDWPTRARAAQVLTKTGGATNTAAVALARHDETHPGMLAMYEALGPKR